MGWDAYANNQRNKKAFKEASERVRKKVGTVDGFLQSGGLDCSTCATELERATGENVYSEFGWSHEMVKVLARDAFWDYDDTESDRLWALESAREFLETCASINTGINFTW